MRYAIPISGKRISPRSVFAESLLLVTIRHNRIQTERTINISSHALLSLAKMLNEYRIDTLICGGISRENKAYLESCGIDIIDNVASTVDDVLMALQSGILHPGYGLDDNQLKNVTKFPLRKTDAETSIVGIKDNGNISSYADYIAGIDCLACQDRVCLRGEDCLENKMELPETDGENEKIHEAALDIACEEERTLCRLSELIYFCLEMKYQKIGIAFCMDLLEPTEILVRVLRRFFNVIPVCCKIGGTNIADPYSAGGKSSSRPVGHRIACNPMGQAEIFNTLKTDLNVLVGICMGADCILTRFSKAPVTTLFVKDKSLANNPIGAIYSDYYLKEAVSAPVRRS